MIAIIAAMDKQRVIGIKNRLPWRLPADMRRFRELTWGHTVVMGRKTMESIGRPLEGRTNLVLTKNSSQLPEGFLSVLSIDQVLKKAQNETVFIVGGESVYRLFLPYADIIYLTVIDHRFIGDAFFPKFDSEDWQLVSEQTHEKDPVNPYSFVFRVYKHKNS